MYEPKRNKARFVWNTLCTTKDTRIFGESSPYCYIFLPLKEGDQGKTLHMDLEGVDSSVRFETMCLEKVVEKEYHIIFLDHLMPELDGIETRAKMQELTENKNRNTPVIMRFLSKNLWEEKRAEQ